MISKVMSIEHETQARLVLGLLGEAQHSRLLRQYGGGRGVRQHVAV